MNNKIAGCFLPLCMSLLSPTAGTAAPDKAATRPLTLHYDRPATYYEEALVIGNGTLGATVYGGTKTDVVQLNDITLWTGEPEGDPAIIDVVKSWNEAADGCFPAAGRSDQRN